MSHGKYRFDIGATVQIDGGADLIGVVTAIYIRQNGVTYEVSYMHAGDAKCPVIEEFRLTRAA